MSYNSYTQTRATVNRQHSDTIVNAEVGIFLMSYAVMPSVLVSVLFISLLHFQIYNYVLVCLVFHNMQLLIESSGRLCAIIYEK